MLSIAIIIEIFLVINVFTAYFICQAERSGEALPPFGLYVVTSLELLLFVF